MRVAKSYAQSGGRRVRTHPAQLSANEVAVLKHVLTDPQRTHWPVSSLAWWAAREGLLNAGRSTWYRYRKKLGLPAQRVPRKRRHRTGLRATRPDEYWHLDATRYRTGDGQPWYIHVLMDNYSRRKLAWSIHPCLRAAHTVELLRSARATAATHARGIAQLVVDGGPENCNLGVNALLSEQHPAMERLVALQDITFSNSMVEAAHKRLKYGWLHRLAPADGTALRQLVYTAVEEENQERPLDHLQGRTPDEAYFGMTSPLPNATDRALQQAKRREYHGGIRCPTCR